MRKLTILLIIASFAVAACNTAGERCPEVDIKKEMSEIRSVLEQYELAREREDFATVENIWSQEENIVLFGTEGDEQLVGIEAIKNAMRRQFDEFENTLINISDQKIHINASGNTAWFSEVLDYNFIYLGDNMTFEGIRFTGVMEKKDGKWKLVQGHLSVPYETSIDEIAK